MRISGEVHAVLKWAGGKSNLLARILPQLPDHMDTYYEPFIGSGAVFFALAREGRFERAVLSDINEELIDVYRALQTDVDGVVESLRGMKYEEEEYYRVRATKPRSLVRRVARTIYLNKTGFNGLYRVNRSGIFNVPFGRYTNPNICDEKNLRMVSKVLQKVELSVLDFEEAVKKAGPGDAVYFDPPYLPLSSTAYFTAYAKHPFGLEEHERLARLFAALVKRRVAVVLSNSDTPDSRRLYAGFHCEFPAVARTINSKAVARGKVSELLVTGRVTKKK